MKKRTSLGFSFIEILVVVSIIGVLTAVGVVSFQTSAKKARDAKRKADLEQIRNALEMRKADGCPYPSSPTLGGSLSCVIGSSTNTYLNPIPRDPNCSATGCSSGWVDYSYSYSSPNYTLSAKLELTTEIPSPLACSPPANYNYCVTNP